MASEGLSAGALPDVPQLRRKVTCSWDEKLKVWRYGQGHAVSLVSGINSLLGPCLNVPEYAEMKRAFILCSKHQDGGPVSCDLFLPGAVAWAGDDLSVADETAAGKITWEDRGV